MFKNYLKSALRFIKHNKIFAAINLSGLSIALAVSFIIFLFVINELSYNHFNKNRSRIYRVLNYYVDFKNTMSGTPYVLAPVLKEEIPQVEKAIRVKRVRGLSIKIKEDFVPVNDAIATDSEIFGIFTLPLIFGSDPKNIIDDQNSIVLARDLAEKIFPGQDPVGREIIGSINNVEHVFIVRGVFENIPENSTLRAQCFLNSRWSLDDINKAFGIKNADTDWSMDFWTTWVLISKECNPATLTNKFREMEVKHISEKPPYRYSLQNLNDVYLGSDYVSNAGITGSRSKVRLFSAIAFLIILVATINYIILSTAVSTSRGLEIGIRKTFGAINRNIKNQLLYESVFLAIIVLPVALILMRTGLPYAAKLFQARLYIINSNIIVYLSVYLVMTVLIGIVSGLYTSTYLSRLKVMDILKSTLLSGRKREYLRSSLIIIQLVIFCSFVSSELIIRSQYRFAINKDTGFYNKGVVLIDLGNDFRGYPSFISNIKTNPNIIMAAGAMETLPMDGWATMMLPSFQDNTVKVKVEGFAVDYDFLNTMGIRVLQGREFSRDFSSDLTQSVILNETAVKSLGVTDPIGKLIGTRPIIGIVKDFNLHSIHSDIPPLMLTMTDKYIRSVAVHYKPGTLKTILPVLEAEWKKAAPDKPFSYSTIEGLIRDTYSSERNLSTIVSIFALFTLLISAFGLFGLTLFVARSRTREIGIKKVFGCSEMSIVYSFLLNNLFLVIIASVISVPVTLHFMGKWLGNFAFRTDINPVFFVISFIIAAIIVLLTVSVHAYRASQTNPVEALRYE